MSEIREILGMAECRDPTDKDWGQLKKVIRQTAQRNETLYDENKQLGEVIESLRQGKFNETEGAKLILDEAHTQLRFELDEAKAELEHLRRENKHLKTEADKAH
jgi:regulator of replication initiation timing